MTRQPPNPPASTFLRVCTNVALNQHKTNPDKWARLANNKLTSLNIRDVNALTKNIGSLNSQLTAANHSPFHKVTLQGFRTELATIEAINRDPNKPLYGEALLPPTTSPLRPLFKKIAFYLDHTTLEKPQVDNWIDAIIYKLSLIDIKSLRDLHLNLVHLNWLLNNAIRRQDILFYRTLDSLKLELPNHWPDRNNIMPMSFKCIFKEFA